VLVEPVVESPGYERRAWLSVLAKARADEVRAAWEALSERPDYQALRAPEVGLCWSVAAWAAWAMRSIWAR